MTFTLAVAQTAPRKGDNAANLNAIAEVIVQASQAGADVVLFPESAVSGYVLEGGVEECALTPEALAAALSERMSGLARPIYAVIGHYELAAGRPHNSLTAVHATPRGVTVNHTYRKFFLPTYGVFDEGRFHAPGNALGRFDLPMHESHVACGALICEDVWHSILGSLLAMAGARLVFVAAATPAREFQESKPRNLLRYEKMLTALAQEHGMWVAMASLVGFEGGKGLTGGSMIVSPFGEIVAQAPQLEESLLLAEVDLNQVTAARMRAPLYSDLRERWRDVLALASQIDPDVE